MILLFSAAYDFSCEAFTAARRYHHGRSMQHTHVHRMLPAADHRDAHSLGVWNSESLQFLLVDLRLVTAASSLQVFKHLQTEGLEKKSVFTFGQGINICPRQWLGTVGATSKSATFTMF